MDTKRSLEIPIENNAKESSGLKRTKISESGVDDVKNEEIHIPDAYALIKNDLVELIEIYTTTGVDIDTILEVFAQHEEAFLVSLIHDLTMSEQIFKVGNERILYVGQNFNSNWMILKTKIQADNSVEKSYVRARMWLDLSGVEVPTVKKCLTNAVLSVIITYPGITEVKDFLNLN